jgi:hypothetical protein
MWGFWRLACTLLPTSGRKQYQNVLFALDAEKLFAEITKAEATIQRRRSELLQESTTGSDELAAIERALHILAQLRQIEHRR